MSSPDSAPLSLYMHCYEKMYDCTLIVTSVDPHPSAETKTAVLDFIGEIPSITSKAVVRRTQPVTAWSRHPSPSYHKGVLQDPPLPCLRTRLAPLSYLVVQEVFSDMGMGIDSDETFASLKNLVNASQSWSQVPHFARDISAVESWAKGALDNATSLLAAVDVAQAMTEADSCGAPAPQSARCCAAHSQLYGVRTIRDVVLSDMSAQNAPFRVDPVSGHIQFPSRSRYPVTIWTIRPCVDHFPAIRRVMAEIAADQRPLCPPESRAGLQNLIDIFHDAARTTSDISQHHL